MGFFYSPETKLDVNSDVKTVWFEQMETLRGELKANYSTIFKMMLIFFAVDYLLLKIDCRSMNYVTRVKLGYLNNSLKSVKNSFDSDKWDKFEEDFLDLLIM